MPEQYLYMNLMIIRLMKYFDLPDIVYVLSENLQKTENAKNAKNAENAENIGNTGNTGNTGHCKVTILNPKDAQKNNIDEKLINYIYKQPLKKSVVVYGDLSINEEENLFIISVYE